MKKDKDADQNFEKNLLNLQKKVELLEKGDLSLEEALKNYEEGVSLAIHCQEQLKKAEQIVTQLKTKN